MGPNVELIILDDFNRRINGYLKYSTHTDLEAEAFANMHATFLTFSF